MERSISKPRVPERMRYFPMSIIARDPLVLDPTATNERRKILRAVVQGPASRLEPGPRGPRFHVVGFDASRRKLHRPARLASMRGQSAGWNYRDRFLDADDSTLRNDPAFHAQNVYAIAARTLGFFEAALGRPVPWAFGSSQLYLVPTAFADANAYYSDDDRALLFGYFDSKATGQVLTCLAHDIVAHETTHAILDGLRRRFDTPGLPDQAGFHEGFADLVALLSLLSARESVASLLGDPSNPRVRASLLTFDGLRESVLFTIGAEFGSALHLNRGGGLRRSIELPPTTDWMDPTKLEWQEPHRRGEILVAAILETFLQIWTARLVDLQRDGTLDRARTAEEGAYAATRLLEMSIRAIDYCPPVEFEFKDFLAAMVTSDKEVVPDDRRGYRKALEASFALWGITPDIADPVAGGAERPSYRSYSYAALRSDPDEAFRFMWDNAGLINLATSFYTHVDAVRPSVRIGPNGFVVSEWLVDYVQELILSVGELQDFGGGPKKFYVPEGVPLKTQMKIWGGGTLVFDEFGGLKYHQFKELDDWERQQRRLDFLVRHGRWDTHGRLGFSMGTPFGQRFALAQTPTATAGDEW